MELIDTHAHVLFESYDDDREIMMQRAFTEGVKTIVHPCCRVEEIEKLVDLSVKFDGISKPNLYYAVGVHPTETHDWSDEHKKILDKHLSENTNSPNSKLKAIGETGLDYFHFKTESERAIQKKAFLDQIDLAKKYKLPLIIHTRDCFDDTLEILQKEFPKNRNAQIGVLHCYTGDAAFGLACIELGFYVSWSGIVTFKNSALKEVAKQIPLDRTLIETDAPFLAPHPNRGKRNEPSFVTYVADTLADCHNITKDEITRVTTANAKKLFGI